MPRAVTPANIFKQLNAELDRAESFTRDALDDLSGPIPATALVIFKQSQEVEPFPYPLYDRKNIELSVMADIRENLREAGRLVGESRNIKPSCVLSMVEIASTELSFWLGNGFFPADAVPESFKDKDLVLFTAAAENGQVLRRMSLLVDIALPRGRSRQLSQSVQVQLSGEPCEMDVFWEKFKAVRKQSPAQGFA